MSETVHVYKEPWSPPQMFSFWRRQEGCGRIAYNIANLKKLGHFVQGSSDSRVEILHCFHTSDCASEKTIAVQGQFVRRYATRHNIFWCQGIDCNGRFSRISFLTPYPFLIHCKVFTKKKSGYFAIKLLCIVSFSMWSTHLVYIRRWGCHLQEVPIKKSNRIM